ncbi:hypothetical protein D3C73_1257200 [compost metagenome]
MAGQHPPAGFIVEIHPAGRRLQLTDRDVREAEAVQLFGQLFGQHRIVGNQSVDALVQHEPVKKMAFRIMMLDITERQLITERPDYALDTADNIVKELIQKFAFFGHVNQQADGLAALFGESRCDAARNIIHLLHNIADSLLGFG